MVQEIIELNFSECKYLGEIHKALKKQLDFPDYYGENLSALWDCLRYYSFEKTKIIVKGINELPSELKEYMNNIFEIFDEVHSENPNIEFEIVS
ncbi:MAG: barstar family protein [Clostridia bacterium]|nr:barstar family protein [Clostridia bacterium]